MMIEKMKREAVKAGMTVVQFCRITRFLQAEGESPASAAVAARNLAVTGPLPPFWANVANKES